MADAVPRVETGVLIFDDIPEVPPAFAARLAPYLDARAAGVVGWSPTGQLLIRTRLGDVAQLHLVEQPGGARRQLSFGDDPVGAAAFSPNILQPGIAYLRGIGNEQLYYQRSGAGAARLLSDGLSATSDPVWSNSGKQLAFAGNGRDGLAADILLVEPESAALPHLALAGEGPAVRWRALDWSPDDRQLLLLETLGLDDCHLFILDLDSGQRREIEGGGTKNIITAARFGRDAQGVYYLSDRDGEYLQLRYVNLYNGQRQTLSERGAMDVAEFALSADGHYLAYVDAVPDGARLNLLDLRAHQDLTPPHLPAAGAIDSLRFDPEGKRLAFSHSSLHRPRDAYVLDIASNRLEPWTFSESGRADPEAFLASRSLQIPTFDRNLGRQRELPARLYEPGAAGRHPLLIVLCDGDAAGNADGDGGDCPAAGAFDPWLQYLTGELGFAVLEPAVRGSGGHGKSYRALGAGGLREDAVKDIGAVLVWVRAQPTLDPGRVVVAGRGYAGSLALAAMFNYGDRLRGGIAFDAITDFVSFTADSPPGLAPQRRAEFGDEREPGTRALLRRLSALSNSERITKPVLIVEGDADRRFPAAQSEQLRNSLGSHGVRVWHLRAADEASPFRHKHALDVYRQSVAQFLDTLP